MAGDKAPPHLTPPRPRPLMLRPDSAPPPGLASPLLMACPPASSTPTLPHPTLTRTPTPHAGKTLGLRLGNCSAQAPPPPGSLPGPPPAPGPEGGVLLVSHRARVHVALPQYLPPCLGQGSCVPVVGPQEASSIAVASPAHTQGSPRGLMRGTMSSTGHSRQSHLLLASARLQSRGPAQ